MEHDSRRKFVINETPDLKRILDAASGQPGSPNADASDTHLRTNAISGQWNNPRRSLRPGFQPQK